MIKLDVIGLEDPVDVLVDTGFNGGLMLFDHDVMPAGLRVRPGTPIQVELAGGAEGAFREATGRVLWFGVETIVSVLVAPTPRRPEQTFRAIGAELLARTRLTIDYPRQRLSIALG